MADMDVMTIVSQGTDLTKKQEEMHSILDMHEYKYRRVIAMHHIRRARAPTHTQLGLIIKQSP